MIAVWQGVGYKRGLLFNFQWVTLGGDKDSSSGTKAGIENAYIRSLIKPRAGIAKYYRQGTESHNEFT